MHIFSRAGRSKPISSHIFKTPKQTKPTICYLRTWAFKLDPVTTKPRSWRHADWSVAARRRACPGHFTKGKSNVTHCESTIGRRLFHSTVTGTRLLSHVSREKIEDSPGRGAATQIVLDDLEPNGDASHLPMEAPRHFLIFRMNGASGFLCVIGVSTAGFDRKPLRTYIDFKQKQMKRFKT